MAGNVMMFPTSFDLNMEGIMDDGMPDLPGSDTEIKLGCRNICIGTYSYKPRSKVRISSEGVTILAPSLGRRAADDVILHIPLKSVVHVVARASARPAVLLYTEAKTGEYVRGALDMHADSGPYFNPASTVDEHKRITLVPRALTRRSVTSLRSLFGMVLDELDALDSRRFGDSSRDSASDVDQPSPGNAAGDPPSRPETPINVKDNASTSSSVIFPPSPTPISLSSHSSSLHTQKSSHSSKKRKSRKKNKTNKKMKYVLVKNPEPHAVDAFLAGVAPILKSLSPVFLNLAKSEIISAALKYERQMLMETCNGVSEK